MNKYYVDVILKYSKDGIITPLAIIWEDGHKYEIDKVLSIDKKASEAGGFGTRYRCRIQRQERNLYFDELTKMWFVESEK